MNVNLKNTVILIIFSCLTVFFTVFLVLISKDEQGSYFIIGSAFELFAFSFIICSILLFYYLWKKNPDLIKKHIVFIIIISLISLFYLNFLTEYHPKSWDFMSYYLAAKGMEEGINIYDAQVVTEFNRKFNYGKTTYLYTPLLATIIGLFNKIDESKFFILYEFSNFYALVFFLILLYLILLKYKMFSKNLISIFILLIFLLNVPIMRTLTNNQINFYTIDLILLSILFYRKNDFVSASLLCLAANIKFSPLLLIGAFILQKNWKWLYYFCFVQLLIIIITSIIYGHKYWILFINSIFEMNPPTSFRNNSLDSLFWNLYCMINLFYQDGLLVKRFIVIGSKLVVFYWVGKLLILAVRDRIFYRYNDSRSIVYNSLPILIICMVIASPYIWPHHFIFIIFPVILLLSCCKYKSDFALYLVGYLLIFVVPVFDIFPFSYHRIFGVFIFLFILNRAVLKKSYDLPDFVVNLREKLGEVFYENKGFDKQYGKREYNI